MVSPSRSGVLGGGEVRADRAGTPLRLASLLYVAVIPLDSVAVLPGRSLTSLVGGALIGLWLLELMFGGRRRRREMAKRPTAIYVASLAFVAWAALSVAWSINPESSQTRVVSYVALALSIPALSRGLRRRFSPTCRGVCAIRHRIERCPLAGLEDGRRPRLCGPRSSTTTRMPCRSSSSWVPHSRLSSSRTLRMATAWVRDCGV